MHRSTMPRQCGDAVLRMLVTGGPPNFGGGGIPQRIIISSRSPSIVRTTGAGQSGKTPGIGGRLPAGDLEQVADRGLVLGDGVKVTHSPYLLGSPIRFRPQILVAWPAAQGPL